MYRFSRKCTKCMEDYWSLNKFVLPSLCSRILENNVFTNNNISPSRNITFASIARNEKASAKLVYENIEVFMNSQNYSVYMIHIDLLFKWLNIEQDNSIRKGSFEAFDGPRNSQTYPIWLQIKEQQISASEDLKKTGKSFQDILSSHRTPILRVDRSRDGSGRNLLFKISFNYFIWLQRDIRVER